MHQARSRLELLDRRGRSAGRRRVASQPHRLIRPQGLVERGRLREQALCRHSLPAPQSGARGPEVDIEGARALIEAQALESTHRALEPTLGHGWIVSASANEMNQPALGVGSSQIVATGVGVADGPQESARPAVGVEIKLDALELSRRGPALRRRSPPRLAATTACSNCGLAALGSPASTAARAKRRGPSISTWVASRVASEGWGPRQSSTEPSCASQRSAVRPTPRGVAPVESSVAHHGIGHEAHLVASGHETRARASARPLDRRPRGPGGTTPAWSLQPALALRREPCLHRGPDALGLGVTQLARRSRRTRPRPAAATRRPTSRARPHIARGPGQQRHDHGPADVRRETPSAGSATQRGAAGARSLRSLRSSR